MLGCWTFRRLVVTEGKSKYAKPKNFERQPIKDWPESERPREKLLQLGPEGLSDGELIAVLLRIGKSGQSAEDLGRHLMSKFNGISGIDRAHIEELLAVPGMGVAKTAQLKAAIEIGKRARRQTAQPKDFRNAADVAAYIRPRFERQRQECFLALLLDGQNRLLAERVIAEGIPTQATYSPARLWSCQYMKID
jgi:DNA repair protein RadC